MDKFLTKEKGRGDIIRKMGGEVLYCYITMHIITIVD